MPVVRVEDHEVDGSEEFPYVTNVGDCRILRAHENRSQIQRSYRVDLLLGEQRSRQNKQKDEWLHRCIL